MPYLSDVTDKRLHINGLASMIIRGFKSLRIGKSKIGLGVCAIILQYKIMSNFEEYFQKTKKKNFWINLLSINLNPTNFFEQECIFRLLIKENYCLSSKRTEME